MMRVQRLAFRLAQTAYVRRLLAEEPDLGVFKAKPSTRFLFGLALIGVSYSICWPVIGALGAIAYHLHKPLLFTIGSPLIYGFSHLVFLAGAWFAGPDAIQKGKMLYRWLVRMALLKALGQIRCTDKK
jgi:hypothetical protein